MEKSKGSTIIRGDGIVEGIVFGNALVYTPEKLQIPKYFINDNQIDREIERLKRAIEHLKSQLNSEKKKLQDELGNIEADIIQSHIMITEDPFFTEDVPEQIKKKKRNVEWIIMDGVTKILEGFKEINDLYFKERGRDIEDISLRLIKILRDFDDSDYLVGKSGILVVKELIPSMIFLIDPTKITGIISEYGSETSHATILAKSLGIPVVINAKEATRIIEEGNYLILDGNVGYVVVNPTESQINEYKKINERYQNYRKDLEKISKLPAVTRDGTKISLHANIEIVPGSGIALRYGAEGVGLFRTEMPFLIRNRIIPENEQFDIYRALFKIFKGKPVTIRTLDIGGDKLFPFQKLLPEVEKNPFLGLRSIRLSLYKPDIFREQIRAILRASHYGKAKILLPMISSLEELLKVQEIINEEKHRLRSRNIPFDHSIEVGVMIEIPSAALAAEELIKYCDFFSIGTNDLVQYTLAVDRTNKAVADYYIPENPAVLRLIYITAQAAVGEGKTCAVCGELAGNPMYTAFFLGTGIRELSMHSNRIPEIKKLIRNMDISEAENLVHEAMKLKKVFDIKKLFEDFYNKHIGKEEKKTIYSISSSSSSSPMNS